MALNSLFCADVPLRNSLTHSLSGSNMPGGTHTQLVPPANPCNVLVPFATV